MPMPPRPGTNMANRIKGKLAFITGGSAGIGAATARRLAQDGADLILWARRTERLGEVANEIRNAFGVNVTTATVDVRDRTAVTLAAKQMMDDAGVPHILFNNAGLAAGMSTIQEGEF